MKLLHINASPRGAQSNTLRVAKSFVDTLRSERGDEVEIDVIDLFDHDLPAVDGDNLAVKYSLMVGRPISPQHAESWREIEALIQHFKSADAYLITSPMWNFNIPYALKYYIDCIVQPGYAFAYTPEGYPVPLIHGKKMLCITARGGDYSAGGPMASYDFQEPYLRAIFGFIGITDIEFINVQPTDITPELRQNAVEAAIEVAERTASRVGWGALVNA